MSLSPFAEWEMQSMDGSIGGGGITELLASERDISSPNGSAESSSTYNAHLSPSQQQYEKDMQGISWENPDSNRISKVSSVFHASQNHHLSSFRQGSDGGNPTASQLSYLVGDPQTSTASLSTFTTTASAFLPGEKSDGSPPGLSLNMMPMSQGDQQSNVPQSIGNVPPSLIFANNAIKVRPCDICRRRKARCILVQGSTRCEHCETRNLPCTFIQGPRPRKKPTKRKSEKGFIPGQTSENSSNVTLTANSHVDTPSTVSIDIKRRRYEADDDNLIKDVRPIKDYSSMRGHSLLKKTMSLQYPRSSFYIGSTSIYDSRLFDIGSLDKLDQASLAGDIYVRRPAPDIYFTLNNDHTYAEAIADSDAVERVVAPHGKSLINLYFRIVHPSLPILAKKVFMEKYSRTHREFSAPLLAGVYILALNWWYYDPQLSPHPKPDVNKLHQLATKTFSKVSEHPKLSSVQAGLLLVQCHPNHAGNWSMCAQVTALAEELGLGLNCQNWRLPKWERGLRKRVAWAVFLQDKWLSLIESRPSHIQKNNWMVKYLTLEEFPDISNEGDDQEGSADIEDGKLLFMEMIGLGEIVSEIMDTLFTFQSKQNIRNTESILKYAKPIQLKLKKWYQKLPPSLRMVSSKPRRLSSNGYLHLAYFAAEITLHRRIIRSLTSTSPPDLVQVCRAAAKERLVAALDFVRSLRPEHIQSFWHFSAPANFALVGTFAAILYITSVTPEESEFYKTQLSDCLWALRISSGFDQMAAALQMLTVAISGVPGLQLGEAERNIDEDEEEGGEDEEEDSYEDAIQNDVGDDSDAVYGVDESEGSSGGEEQLKNGEEQKR